MNERKNRSEVRRAWALGDRLDVELHVLALFEIRSSDILHVEADIVARLVRCNESEALPIVEEINRTV